ncbi:DUF4959 domain-containing protein [Parasegetibacter sp. NRK P23]|uniref:DUF4959 domain-containing protein n=1 Tax=Parasegetibacter sp. NRK P23 TaxID=2942999 RepID=UPI002043047D|nr:DUF5000 domain-containing lipoprotein [Parasegetibacter sp. NRK P23]MCM5528680.1 DUF4959 domain-containing protein [Parasegetibacter sp. NRK P23]
MKLTIKTIMIMLLLGTVVSCRKSEGHNPINDDPVPPAVVTGVSVVNLPGKAKITYQVPNDERLLYVKAEYVPTSGVPAEAKASYYLDSLIVEGFADTKEYEVKLYSVSRSGVESEPVVVKVQPQEAPIWKVFKSMKVLNAFGGFNITAENPSKDNIGLIVLSKNKFLEYEANNNWSVFTNVDSILQKIRGLDTTLVTLGFLVRDRWGNTTDTLFQDIKPIFEVQLDPSKFRGLALPGDAPQVTNGARLEYAWDNRLGWPYTSFTHQVNGGPQPHMITFDMGVLSKLSRVYIRPYPEGSRWYFLTTMKRFEIYGSENPSSNGALDASWTLLGYYEVVKPSGLPYGTDNNLDQTTASAGFNWEIRLDAPRVRYLRIRCLENFAGGTAQSINELKVYGDPR